MDKRHKRENIKMGEYEAVREQKYEVIHEWELEQTKLLHKLN